jgi:hypothetical protein
MLPTQSVGSSAILEEELASTTLSRAKCGYAMKKSGTMGRGWQKRFIVITADSELSYYLSQKDFQQDALPQGSFHLGSSVSEISKVSETILDLNLNGGRSFQLDFGSVESTDAWYSVLLIHFQNE